MYGCTHVWGESHERVNVGGVSITRRDDASSRKGCVIVINGQTPKANGK